MRSQDEFKNQWREDQWQCLIRDPEFLRASDDGEFDLANEIASRILHGEAKTARERKRLKLQRTLEDIYF